jgi:hypothetical protein
VFDAARARRETGKGTLLFVDEVHRFNRAQQDSFLPVMEDGTVVLVGATDGESILRAQRGAAVARPRAGVPFARCRRRSKSCLPMRRRSRQKTAADAEARAALARMADGDGRAALTLAEEVWRSARKDESSTQRNCRTSCSACADLRQVGRRPLQPDLGPAQVGARLRSGCCALLSRPHARCGEDPCSWRAAWCEWRWKTLAWPIRRRW